MNRIALAATAAALALAAAGCAPQPSGAPQPSAAPVSGKPSAPVSVDAQLSTGSARVTLRFDADAKDVRVDVHGTAGLAVTSSAAPIENASFARGEATTFDVSFTPGPGRSYLAVAVSGDFPGAGRRAAVTGFAVGEPSQDQLNPGGTVVEGAKGERVKIVGPAK